MIRSTLTAHLAENHRRELTLQLNDREIGLLASQRQQHYVASGNRRVQLIVGILSKKDDPESIHDTRVQLRQWQMAFRDLQVYGLSRFLKEDLHNGMHADFLFIMSSDISLVFCPQSLGVYLYRGERIYRQQPTYKPDINLSDSLRRLDFYAFRPSEEDNILIIDPEFLDLFLVEELEEFFGDMRQINVSMAELSNMAAQAGYANDTTWFAIHVQKIDFESISSYINQSTHSAKAGDDSSFLQSIRRSKVVPLRDGNWRILPPGLERAEAYQKYINQVQTKAPKFISPNEKPEKIHSKSKSLDKDDYPSAVKTQDKNPPTPTFTDKIKMWNADSLKEKFQRFLYRISHLFENSRGLSILTLIAIITVVLSLIVWGVKSISNKRSAAKESGQSQSSVSFSEMESTAVASHFEIEVEVRANSLQVMSKPKGDDLVATLKRGDIVYQTSKAEDGWVHVKLPDGRAGFVIEALLFPNTVASESE